MRFEHGILASAPRLPEKGVARPVAGNEHPVVRRNIDGRDPVGVLADLRLGRTIGRAHEPNHLLRAAEANHPLVGRYVGGQQPVERITPTPRNLSHAVS